MILPRLSVGFISTLILGSFLPFIKASHETLNDGVVDLGSSAAQLSDVVARDEPPKYETPTYGYGYPPPYHYGTSTLTSVSVSSTSPESISSTVVDPSTVTTTDQSSYSSNTTSSTIDDQTRTTSSAFQSTDESASASSKNWVESSVLGITGTLTQTTPEGMTFSTASTLPTSSESTTSTGISSSLPTASGYSSSNGGIIVSSTSHANNTMTTTITGTTEISTTDLVTSSGLSFESSQLPITASLSSRFNYSSFSTTWSNSTTETPGPGVASSKSTSTPSSLTWPPVFNITFSASPIYSGWDISRPNGDRDTPLFYLFFPDLGFTIDWVHGSKYISVAYKLWIAVDTVICFGNGNHLDQLEAHCAYSKRDMVEQVCQREHLVSSVPEFDDHNPVFWDGAIHKNVNGKHNLPYTVDTVYSVIDHCHQCSLELEPTTT
ncbi:hypothetical protein E4U55_000336 [Claviceps digitariae]|nr:hypothetical protein E4U55_000336 [Claviceps digitariae]